MKNGWMVVGWMDGWVDIYLEDGFADGWMVA